jgi:hypothetical protein
MGTGVTLSIQSPETFMMLELWMADGGYGNGLIKGFPTSTIRNPPSDIKDL